MQIALYGIIGTECLQKLTAQALQLSSALWAYKQGSLNTEPKQPSFTFFCLIMTEIVGFVIPARSLNVAAA